MMESTHKRQESCPCSQLYQARGDHTLAPVLHSDPYDTKKLRHLSRRIGRNIHLLRDEQKLTLQKLAGQTRISIVTLDHFELGKNEMTLRELFKIASALGVNPVDLMC